MKRKLLDAYLCAFSNENYIFWAYLWRYLTFYNFLYLLGIFTKISIKKKSTKMVLLTYKIVHVLIESYRIGSMQNYYRNGPYI